MKHLALVVIGSCVCSIAFADFFDAHKNIFKNQQLCSDGPTDMSKADLQFKVMLATLEKDDTLERKSTISVEKYSAYSTVLKNELNGLECSIISHDDCYSAYCE